MVLAVTFFKQKCLPVCSIVAREDIQCLVVVKKKTGKGKLAIVENDINVSCFDERKYALKTTTGTIAYNNRCNDSHFTPSCLELSCESHHR